MFLGLDGGGVDRLILATSFSRDIRRPAGIAAIAGPIATKGSRGDYGIREAASGGEQEFILRFAAARTTLCDGAALALLLPATSHSVAWPNVMLFPVSAVVEPVPSFSAAHYTTSSCACSCSDSPPTSTSS